ncbi:MAG TPA: acyl-CoA carboxylase epsilon subunit [Actinophytocola sp.]|uniref:acyl-CoA carboxylase epsilon subunit n=1 Tax=Actinophytocola sp. TaxID=1872138 RepID=UPI002DBAD068|nr:acyl-CoA carboxylase epsilon subunit [Actinophytocola sp.]HEU5473626.1 acyl-CoA carboxylase epsilon subunit [Actinophytocola sp.]
MAEDPVLAIESGTLDDIELGALLTVLCFVARQQPDARPLATTRWLYPERAAVFVPPHSWRSAG